MAKRSYPNMLDHWKETDESIKAATQADCAGKQRLYETVGMFMYWFGEVEIQIDRNVMHLLGLTRNYEIYGILAEKSGFATKYEMFRLLMKGNAIDHQKPIGDNLNSRLNHFKGNVNNLRTRFAHSLLGLESDRIYFQHTGAMLDRPPIKQRPSEATPASISFIEVSRVCLWMRDFRDDLSDLASITYKRRAPQTYEIIHPRSSLPGSGHLDREGLISLKAKAHKL